MNLTVFISGGGTTLQNLIDRTRDGRLAAHIGRVVSSRRDAFGLERAKAAGIPTLVADAKRLNDPTVFADADLVVLAGFLKLLPISPEYEGRVINIHPALLPAFGGRGMYGRRVHAAVLEHGVKVSGCTAHFVDTEYDRGPIILQRPVPVLEGDDVDTLAARVFAAECEALPEAIALYAAGRLERVGRRVRILPA